VPMQAVELQGETGVGRHQQEQRYSIADSDCSIEPQATSDASTLPSGKRCVGLRAGDEIGREGPWPVDVDLSPASFQHQGRGLECLCQRDPVIRQPEAMPCGQDDVTVVIFLSDPQRSPTTLEKGAGRVAQAHDVAAPQFEDVMIGSRLHGEHGTH
jgi:hypothetical protein